MGLHKVSLALLMLLVMAALAHARTDLFGPSFFRQLDEKQRISSGAECCENCVSVGSSYRCMDVFTACSDVDCDTCICLASYPPQCSCYDLLDSCTSTCNSDHLVSPSIKDQIQAHHNGDHSFESVDHHLSLNTYNN